ncbi:hypothetical protein COHA_005893 [Chlorella ohadii]|uniref:O-fucosyltransferase family protein n=1 Tax=Chlorella ohadii TaxID=2649997 RepID=A0AAD5DLX7_9CHLO|nr:hypothetical protein COHA_005893 [Chlorella ohadii]
MQPQPEALRQPAVEEAGQPATGTLSFLVCNGFANQRIAVLSGIVLAAELNRTLVMPHLLLDGMQQASAEVNEETGAQHINFWEVFDQHAFETGLKRLGVRVTTAAPLPGSTIHVSLEGVSMDSLRAVSALNPAKNLRLGCPGLRVEAQLMERNEALVFGALEAMQPARPLRNIADSVKAALRRLSPTQAYNVLHLRVEEDWVKHCARWENIPDGVVRDNCLNHTDTVGDSLTLHGIDKQVPLLVITNWPHAQASLAQQALDSLRENGYTVVRRDELLSGWQKQPPLERELSALIDYYVSLGCHQFIGNSVSTFSALLILERRHHGRFAAYYNGGDIPLEYHLPLYRMPWVFTYNDWSAGSEYDFMITAVVTSAIHIGRVQPYCLYSGSKAAPVYSWLLSRNVTIIEHEPAWGDEVAREAARNKEANLASSHLYSSAGRVVGAFQRIDIPILPQLLQFEFVLFTDCDVYFRQHIKLVDWGTPLPKAVGMAYEAMEGVPYNDGTMLYNMPTMRQTYPAFLEWVLSQRNGHHYGAFGPLDQGAINQFYAPYLNKKPMSQIFNAKPYHPFNPAARIVHFHGPKPNHYLEWRLTGKCHFNDMCRQVGICCLVRTSGRRWQRITSRCNLPLNLLLKAVIYELAQGFAGGICLYAAEYATVVPAWDVAAQLNQVCNVAG